MTGDGVPDRDSAGGPVEEPGGWDAALARLEDVLLAAPYDRALPALSDLLRRADVPLSLVLQDERATKILREAILARPMSSRDEVSEARGQVELMSLEVEVLTARLSDPDASDEAIVETRERLAQIQRELSRLRDLL